MGDVLFSNFVKTDEITDLWGFIKTVDWTEGWLIGLVLFHIILTTLTIITRHHHTIQGYLFFSLLVTVRSSEFINEYAAKNWQMFSKQQYFDSGGLFISVVFSMPVLFNCMMIVINWLWQSSNLMAKLKKIEMEAKCRAAKTIKEDDNKKKE